LTLPDRLDAYAIELLFAFLGATWIGLLIVRFLLAPSKLFWEQHDKAHNLQIQLATLQGGDGGPDWPIHELFSYLEPEVLERPEENLWQKAGDVIRDALSLGRLTAWGRPYKTQLGDWVGERAALRPIEKTYWEKAYFTYFFFDSTAQDQTHCYADRDTGRPAYTDLRVNRAQTLKIWPGEPEDIAENYANVRVADSPSVIELFESSERTKLLGLFGSGRLTTWARPSAGIRGDLFEVQGRVWSTHEFRFAPKQADDDGTINQTYLIPRHGGASSNYDICLNFAQLRRSKCDIR
jgi:hypothetical protein